MLNQKMKVMRKLNSKTTLMLIAILALSAIITACGGDKTFERVDYFKDSNNGRIFLIYTETTDSLTILNYSSKLMHTAGKQTTAFFYNDPADIIKVSARNSHYDALGVASESKYFVRYDKYPTGKEKFMYND